MAPNMSNYRWYQRISRIRRRSRSPEPAQPPSSTHAHEGGLMRQCAWWRVKGNRFLRHLYILLRVTCYQIRYCTLNVSEMCYPLRRIAMRITRPVLLGQVRGCAASALPVAFPSPRGRARGPARSVGGVAYLIRAPTLYRVFNCVRSSVAVWPTSRQ